MVDILIENKKDCVGCHACYSICPVNCITMNEDNEGFKYPKVDYSKCVECNKCINVCPVISKSIPIGEVSAYACINKDESIRLDSSSGGIFTLIAENIINQGGIVFGACFDDNFTVVHHYVDTIAELSRLRGSKYVQSIIGDTYKQVKEFLETGKMVLFTGTPCQVGGLKSYLGKDYDSLICQDIICHGVPSPKVWDRYIDYREKIVDSKVKVIRFRCKDEGWKRFSMSFKFSNNTEYRQTANKDLYMQAFFSNVCLRPSCFSCKFKTLNRISDITLADFWGVKNIIPEMDDDKGTSLVMVHSPKGKRIIDAIADKINKKEVISNIITKTNSAAIKSALYNKNREKFMSNFENISFDRVVTKYAKLSWKLKIRKIILTILIKLKLKE